MQPQQTQSGHLVSAKTGTPGDGDRNEHHFRTDHLKADLGSRTARGGLLIAASQGIKFSIGLAAPSSSLACSLQ